MSYEVVIVNKKERDDRRISIIGQFRYKKEFHCKIINPIPHKIGAISLWETLKVITSNEKMKNSPYFIFCEDDHKFTKHYSLKYFANCIAQAQKVDADILCGGISWFQNGIQISDNLFWVEKFSGMQFTVIFNKFYQDILNVKRFTNHDATDYKISNLTKNIFVMYPYISIQKNFGYSDVTKMNNEENRIERLFLSSSENFSLLRKVKLFYT